MRVCSKLVGLVRTSHEGKRAGRALAGIACTGAACLLAPSTVLLLQERPSQQAPSSTPAQPSQPAQPVRPAPAVQPAQPSQPALKQPSGDPVSSAKKAAPTRTISVDQEMIKSRRLFLTGEVNDESAKVLVQQLLFLQADDPDMPVTLYINSGGGLVHSGLAILDVMSCLSVPVKTVAYGRCYSIAAVLLAAGSPGSRSAYPHARLMIHEPSCSYPKLQASDLLLKANELSHTKDTLEAIFSRITGRPKEEISSAVARDRYMSVTEAKDFGLIDHVIPSGRASKDSPAKQP
eukprot:TRINITY_DN50954_c0_g1_i1.p1 TRINITY_DN50954_c0_g1~~TRINITY_DN50954_c0_g1_i1.p1  ORF type:complete len:310 (+),score=60.08 TRINITY_DN50954_c0_g1_i1:60-932(+)